MNPLTGNFVAFLCVFSAAVTGIVFGKYLPEHYQKPSRKD